jgi:two-component system, chemotaxis family, sensor kinase CheA
VQISREALRALARGIQAGMPAREASEAIETLLLEPISLPLARLGDYARALGARLGKGDLSVIIDDGGLLVDPSSCAPVFAVMVHLVRNAVDHGLDAPDERRARGKGAATLSLSTVVSGQEIRISVQDNGRGIDWDRVRAVAESRGLPSASAKALEEVLFAPDFSTRLEVTSTSGRGMGLAAVRSAVEGMGGQIEVESTRGQGSVFAVRLPCAHLGVTRRVNGQG